MNNCALSDIAAVLKSRQRFVVMSHGRKVCDVSKADTTIEELTRHVVLT